MKQYYITLPGGSPAGPVSLDALKVMARNGRLQPEHLYCEDGGAEWRPVTELVIIHSASPVVPPVPGAVPTVSGAARPATYLVISAVLLGLSLLVFPLSIIFALVAVVYAGLAESSLAANNLPEVAHRGRVAKVWCIVTGGTMVLQLLFVVVLAVVFLLSSTASM